MSFFPAALFWPRCIAFFAVIGNLQHSSSSSNISREQLFGAASPFRVRAPLNSRVYSHIADPICLNHNQNNQNPCTFFFTPPRPQLRCVERALQSTLLRCRCRCWRRSNSSSSSRVACTGQIFIHAFCVCVASKFIQFECLIHWNAEKSRGVLGACLTPCVLFLFLLPFVALTLDRC